MRRVAWFLGIYVTAWVALAAPERAATGEMALPSAANWGAGGEATPVPTGPTVPSLRWLQTLIDQTPEGGVLRPPPGRYSGPVLLRKPITIEGGGMVIIDGGGVGTVFTVETADATLRGLTFTGSGSSHSTDDTCLNVRGHRNTVDNNAFEDCLFGIDLKQANHNAITSNRIRSKPLELGMRGDALRLWYSMDNRVEHNVVTNSRDMVVWYSNGNTIKDNTSTGSRYSLHFMFATDNVVEGNRFYDNSVGIYVMYTEGVIIRNNIISHSAGPTGMGIGFKEASDSEVSGNTIIYCALGIASDLSPYQPDSSISIRNNRIAYNGVGLSLVGDKTGTVIEGNLFEGNIDQVSQSGGGGAMRSTWKGNYWDDYQGFDRNRDNIGDTPHEIYAYTDRIWMETPTARFFKNAPLMEAIDFLERLAPFSTPELLVRDNLPLFVRPERGAP
jgi:nitrous oxidase accessory protein